VIHSVPITTVSKNQVLAVEQWLVADGSAVLLGQPVIEIELVQLVEDDWIREMLRESEIISMPNLEYPCSICCIQIQAEVSGIIRQLKSAGDRITCGEPLFEIVEDLPKEDSRRTV
jgi:hypothetical protein